MIRTFVYIDGFNLYHGALRHTLEQAATFYKHIRESALASSQLPPVLTDAQGSFHKPQSW